MGRKHPWVLASQVSAQRGLGALRVNGLGHSVHLGSPGQGTTARRSRDTSSPRSHTPHSWGKAFHSGTCWGKGNSAADQGEAASLVMSLQRPLLTKLNRMCPARRSAESQAGMKVKVAQSCRTLCDPKDYTVRGILQARIQK